MKLRVAPTVLAGSLAFTLLAVAPPATAAPVAPTIGTLSTTVPEHVTGTVATDEPYAVVWLSDGYGPWGPSTTVTLAEGDAFDLDTSGFGGYHGQRVTLYAAACTSPTYDGASCTVSTKTFVPSELAPAEVVWSQDTSIGPGDPDPTITVTDHVDGNGTFDVVQIVRDGDVGRVGATAPVTAGTTTEIAVEDTLVGSINLRRCSADRSRCRYYGAEVPGTEQPMAALRSVTLGTSEIAPVSLDRGAGFTLSGGASGQAAVTWHLERVSAPGIPVGDTQNAQVSVDATGRTAAIPIPTEALVRGTDEYVAVGFVDLQTTDFGLFPDLPFASDPFTVSPVPTVTWTANHSVIYPNVNNSTYPGTVSWRLTGLHGEELSRVEVWSSADQLVVGAAVSASTSSVSVVQWNGRGAGNKAAPSGYYKLKLWDSDGDVIAAKPIVRVDARRLVTKQWVKTVSAAGSVVDKYVGRCSTLRKPAGRGWTYSLGFWANTKCSTTGATASLVSTVHAIRLPKVAGNYASVRVSMYGGAATSKTGSRGVIRYLTAAGKWTSETVVTSPLGYHSGLQRTASGMVYSDRSFAWGFYTLNSHRYDVKSFTVVVRYNVLG